MRLSRVMRPVLVAACCAAVIVGGALTGNPTAAADPIADAQAQLQQLEAQTSSIEDDYNASQQRMTAAQAQQTQLASDISAQQAALDALKPAIAWIVTLERQGSSLDLAASFLLNNSPDEFLSNMATTASVDTLLNEQVARYVSEQQRLADLNTTLQSTIAQIQTETDQQKQLLAQAQAKQNAAQQVLNRLTAQQQAALTAAQQAQNTAALQAATALADTGVAATGGGAGSSKAQIAAAWALKQVGKAYTYGGAGPNSFDCSGLTMVAYRQAGISLPHSATAQSRMGTAVSRANLEPGDLLFFYTPIHHVGIYVGNGMMVDASDASIGTVAESINSAFRLSNFNSARRIA